jgi:hypothetical protein
MSAHPKPSQRFRPSLSVLPWCLLLIGMAFGAGCEPVTHYKVELRPQSDGLERTLTIWQTQPEHKASEPPRDPLSEEARTRLQALFDHYEFNVEDKRHLFRGMVNEKTPPDIGGAGSYLRLANPMGAAFVYLERIRGEDDQAKVLERRLTSIDQLSGHLAGWLQTELSAEPGWEFFKKFLEEDFRRDIKNIYLYFWSMGSADNFGSNLGSNEIMEKAEGALLARVIQYLSERDYLSLREMPVLMRWLNGERDDIGPFLEFLQARLSKKLKADLKPMSLRLGELFRDDEKAEASFVAYFEKTPAYQKKLEAWRQSHPESEKPSPTSLISDLIDDLIGEKLFGSPSTFPVEVQLFLASEPEHTNGHWEDGKVTWRDDPQRDLESPSDVPMLCYAIWTQPNRRFQETQFGRVVLEGEALIEYSYWYESLTLEEAGKWDDHLTSMRPGPDLEARLKDFRFVPLTEDSQSKDESSADYSDEARNLILRAFRGK